MFRHSVGKNCNFGLKCTRRLCPYRHDLTNTRIDTDMMIDDGEHIDKDHDNNSDIYFPIFSWNPSTHLGHEVIKPKCLNASNVLLDDLCKAVQLK